ncbi:hypothetical protein HYW44_01935 [Candidatus Daviesbacteria bacterium]|nr:hypothetical protein [Candidatus Daviesbacteria bacterium]
MKKFLRQITLSLLTLSSIGLILAGNVYAQYGGFVSTSGARVTPKCNLSTNNPQMDVTWSDSNSIKSTYEIRKTNGVKRATGDGLKGFYFANKDLKGTPILEKDGEVINHNWGSGAPSPAVSATGDNFSASWVGFLEIPDNADYTFHLNGNDGKRLYLNGVKAIDDWKDTNNATTKSSDPTRFLAGSKIPIRIEYYDRKGNAEIHLTWSYNSNNNVPIEKNKLFSSDIEYQVITPAPITPRTTPNGLKASYFPNKNLTGNPIYEVDGENVNFNWGDSSPNTLVPTDNFSARWSGQVLIPKDGDYVFSVDTSDGGILYLDGIRIINEWGDHNNTKSTSADPITLAANTKHNIIFEYYEKTGKAEARLNWSYPGVSKTPIPTGNLFSSELIQNFNSLLYLKKDGLYASYYTAPDLSGYPVLKRIDKKVDFAWGNSTPDPSIPGGEFGAKWAGQVLVPNVTDNYSFYVNVKDGARLFIDGVMVIDSWTNKNSPQEIASDPIKLAANSRHNIMLEYYSKTGNPKIQLGWSAPSLPKQVINQNAIVSDNTSGNFYSAEYQYIDNSVFQPNTFTAYSVLTRGVYGSRQSAWTDYQLPENCGAITISPNPIVSCNTIETSWTADPGTNPYGIFRAEINNQRGFTKDTGNSLTGGLLSYWGFNERGATAVDSKGLNNGTANGTQSINGFYGGLGRYLNGISDYIQIPSVGSNPDLNFTKNFTIAGWINPARAGGTRGILSKIAADNSIQYALSLDGNKLRFDYQRNNNFNVNGGQIKVGTLVFIAVTVDNSSGPNISLYVDDPTNPVKTGTAPAETLVSNNPIEFGRQSNNNNSYFEGIIEDFGIWSRVLTSQELMDLYNAGLANPYNPSNTRVNIVQLNNSWPQSPYSDSPPPDKMYTYQVSNFQQTSFSSWTNPVSLSPTCTPPQINLFLTSKGKTLGHNDYPLNVKQNDPVSISWNTTNVPVGPSSCTASIPSTNPAPSQDLINSWSNGKAETGNQALAPISTIGNYQFSLTCSNPQGVSGSSTITLKVEETKKPYFKTTGGDVHTNKGIYISE